MATTAKVNAAMKLPMAPRVSSSPISSSVARGVAVVADELSAETKMPSEKVATASMLLAMTVSRSSMVAAWMLGNRLDIQKLPTHLAANTTTTASSAVSMGMTHRRLRRFLSQSQRLNMVCVRW